MRARGERNMRWNGAGVSRLPLGDPCFSTRGKRFPGKRQLTHYRPPKPVSPQSYPIRKGTAGRGNGHDGSGHCRNFRTVSSGANDGCGFNIRGYTAGDRDGRRGRKPALDWSDRVWRLIAGTVVGLFMIPVLDFIVQTIRETLKHHLFGIVENSRVGAGSGSPD